MDFIQALLFSDSDYNYRARTGFGKLWKLTMPFSRTWKVLGKGGFSKWLSKSSRFFCVMKVVRIRTLKIACLFNNI